MYCLSKIKVQNCTGNSPKMTNFCDVKKKMWIFDQFLVKYRGFLFFTAIIQFLEFFFINFGQLKLQNFLFSKRDIFGAKKDIFGTKNPTRKVTRNPQNIYILSDFRQYISAPFCVLNFCRGSCIQNESVENKSLMGFKI